LYAFQKLLEW